MLVIGVLLFAGEWFFIGFMPQWSTVNTLLSDDIVNMPSLVHKTGVGPMFAVIGTGTVRGGVGP